MQARKIVHIPMSADLVHPGHIKVVAAGNEVGEVTVGLLTDEAIFSKKNRKTIMSYDDRKKVIENIKGVAHVIPQSTADYRPNLLKLRPGFVVHGDDWQDEAKQQVIEMLKEWDGQLVELPYTAGISSTILLQRIKELQ